VSKEKLEGFPTVDIKEIRKDLGSLSKGQIAAFDEAKKDQDTETDNPPETNQSE